MRLREVPGPSLHVTRSAGYSVKPHDEVTRLTSPPDWYQKYAACRCGAFTVEVAAIAEAAGRAAQTGKSQTVVASALTD